MSSTAVDLREQVPFGPSPVPPSLLDDATSLTGVFRELAERHPDWECLVFLDAQRRERRLRVREFWERARDVQVWLTREAIEPGQVVLLTLPTGVEIAAAYFGVMLAGGIPGLVATPSNRLGDRGVYARRVGAILANAQAAALYCEESVAELFRDEPELLAGARLATPAQVPRDSSAPEPELPSGDSLATVQYSSGSTGIPKGILLTHEAMLNNIRAVRDGLGMSRADASVNWIPLYHDMGLIDAFLLPLLSGSPSVLIPTFDFMKQPSLWLWALHRYRGALSWSPNFAYAYCASRVPDEELAGLDLASWRIAINAAEPVLAPTIAAFSQRFAAHRFRPEAMTPAWGLAENVTIATAHPVAEAPRCETIDRRALAEEHRAQPASAEGLASVAIGRCLPRCEVEIRDAEGRRLEDRQVGRVMLRSDSLFVGYLRQEDETSRALVDGWLDTGDQGYLVDGDLYFIARDKDLIVIGGEKYAPHDIETAIYEVPGMRQGCAIAFGALNPERGTEEIAAVAETHLQDEQELAALRRSVRQAVTRTTGLSLRHLLLVPPGGIEKTSSGKLARRATRTRYAAELGLPAALEA